VFKEPTLTRTRRDRVLTPSTGYVSLWKPVPDFLPFRSCTVSVGLEAALSEARDYSDGAPAHWLKQIDLVSA